MRHILPLLLFLVSFASQAQKYSSLWSAVDAAASKDAPKTALKGISSILAKAIKERNATQVLCATLVGRQLEDDVSPDSGTIWLNRLYEEALKPRADVAERAMWCSAAAQVADQQYGDTAADAKARQFYRLSLEDIETLAQTKAGPYLQLFTQGSASKYYSDDLLSVLAKPALQTSVLPLDERRALAHRVIATYEKRGLRTAVLLATIDSIKLQTAYQQPDADARIKTWEALAARFLDLPLNVETYIEWADAARLLNDISEKTDSLVYAIVTEGIGLYGKEARANVLRSKKAELEQARVSVSGPHQVVYPGDTVSLAVLARGYKNIELQIDRLSLPARSSAVATPKADGLKSLEGTNVATLKFAPPTRPAYVFATDTLHTVLQTPGVYRLRLKADGKVKEHDLVYVSALRPVVFSKTGDTCRIHIVDGRTGAIVKGAQLFVYTYGSDGTRTQKAILSPRADGSFSVARTAHYYADDYFATSTSDEALPAFDVNFLGGSYTSLTSSARHVTLFTDRAIYRPGQKVDFSLIAYWQNGDDARTLTGLASTVRLFDSSAKELASLQVTTDSMGVASGSFTLPLTCSPGRFRLTTNTGASTHIRVEEYKRPTFTVSLAAPTTSFSLGDTIYIKGTAESYSKVPIQNAAVRYTLSRRAFRPFLRSDDEDETQTGECATDSAGQFSIPLPLTPDASSSRTSFVRFAVQADVVAPNGETVSASTAVYASKRPSHLALQWPEVICKERSGSVVVSHTGSNGQALPAEAAFKVMQKGKTLASGTLSAGSQPVPAAVLTLPSGAYEVVVELADVDTIRQRFSLFSESDRRLASPATFWTYTTPEENGRTTVLVGTTEQDATLFYDLVCRDRVVESRVVTLSDSIVRFPLTYQEAWGDGAKACFALVRNGELHTFYHDVVRPEPKKDLRLAWTTFRSRLTPGTDETWTLRVTHADGTPARASVMARLYDASLDAFAESPWALAVGFTRRVASAYFRLPSWYNFSMYGTEDTPRFTSSELTFTEWDSRYFSGYAYQCTPQRGRFGGCRPLRMSKVSARTSNAVMLADVATESYTADEASLMSAKVSRAEAQTVSAAAGGSDESAAAVRSNFSETAFFMPALRTDSEGNATLRFRLPESLTTWNFNAIAHTTGMDIGRLDTCVVARKQFQVEPALPRFLRQGDATVVRVAVSNLTEKQLSGKLSFTISDATSGEQLYADQKKFSAAANGQTVVSFPIDASFACDAIVCRVVGKAGGSSDGEEHLLPVLSSQTTHLRSLPFSLDAAGTTTMKIDTLWNDCPAEATKRQLSVEITSNAVWTAVAALPAMQQATSESSIAWATRLYSSLLASTIAQKHPSIARLVADSVETWASPLSRNSEARQTLLSETPWTAEATSEQERLAALARLFNPEAMALELSTATDHLAKLQNADGSWSWFPGMRGNVYVTTDVAFLLARLERLCGTNQASALLTSARRFLATEMSGQVAEMKRDATRRYFSSSHLRYLYLSALVGDEATATTKYLLSLSKERQTTGSMYDKALLAVVLQHFGHKTEATTLRQSIAEHLVGNKEMGAWFDTRRAPSSSRAYRLPTQVAAIEAFDQSATAADQQVARRMRLWLMQSRRTEAWFSARVAADAVYAILQSDTASSSLESTPRPVLFTLTHAGDIIAANAPSKAKGTNTVGYVHESISPTVLPDALTLRKPTDALSWGSVVAQWTAPETSSAAYGQGLHLQRTLERYDGNRWVRCNISSKNSVPTMTDASLAVGSRLRLVFTLTADRDFDFVDLHAAHAACLTPRTPLSGYTWADGESFYRAVRDASVHFYIEHLPKGHHTFVQEYVVDREGTYTLAKTTAQCLYAPEYASGTEACVVEVK